ncbi:MAG: fibronectin type III domain-containing protein [Thermoplasmata archaeon]|nr:fibronectin type III domain-containing protein [Thermoplasmata archaeon]
MWGLEEEISTDIGFEGQHRPSGAVYGDKVHIVWQDWGDGDPDIYYRYFDGSTWQIEVEISNDTGAAYQEDPSIAVAIDKVHVVWADNDDGGFDIFYRHFDGSAWQASSRISIDVGTEGQYDPSIAVQGDMVHVVWEGDGDPGEYDIYYRYFNGSVWLPVEEISVDAGNESQADPSIAVAGDKVHVVWREETAEDCWDIFYRHFNGTSWQSIQEINTNIGTGVHFYPSIAAFDDKVHVVWADFDDGDNDIFYRHFNGTSWQPEQEISTDVGTENQWEPSVAAEGDKAYIAWTEDSDGDPDIYYRFFNGTGWEVEQEISTDISTEIQDHTSIATDGGIAHVVWQDDGDGDWDIYYRNGDEGIGDIVPPTITNLQPPDGVATPFNTPTIGADYYDSFGIDASSVILLLGGLDVTPLSTVTTSNIAYTPAIGLPDGSHTVYLEVKDVAGNLATESWIFYVDTIPPATITDLATSNPTANSVELTWTAPGDDGNSGMATGYLVRYSKTGPISNANWASATSYGQSWIPLDSSTLESHVVSGLNSTTQYWFAVRGYDEVGNCGSASNSPNETTAGTPVPPSAPQSLQAALSGWQMENVTLAWDLSSDDGSGQHSVVGYSIYRNSTYEAEGTGYQLIAFLTNGTSEFVDVLAGEGNPNNYFYCVCAVDLVNQTKCSEGQVAKLIHQLAPGPNLASVPLIQSDESIETVLQTVQYDKAWSYDPSVQEWKWYMPSKGYRRGLWSVNHTMGIWVNVTSDSNLTVAGVVPAQTTIHLYEGWNLVSFPSFNTSYTVHDLKMDTGAVRVEGYDSAPPYHLRVLGDAEVLQMGEAYWVKVEAEIDWVVEMS